MTRILTMLCLILLCASAVSAQQAEVVAADFDASGKVDFSDFLLFAAGFGKSAGQEGYNATLDLTSDDTVDFSDFLVFARSFGKLTSDPPASQDILLYIADLTLNRVEVVNTATNLIDPTRTLEVDQPRGIALSDLNKQIFVAGVDTFYAFTENGAATLKLPLTTSTAPGDPTESRGGFRVVLSKNQTQAFITEESAPAVEVIDLQAGVSKAIIPVPNTPIGIVMAPDGTRAYVAHGNGATALSIINAITPALEDSIPVSHPVTRMAISPDGAKLYLNSSLTGDILAVDLNTKQILHTLTLGQASDIDVNILDVALSKDGTRLAASVNRVFFGFDVLGNPVPVFWGGIVVIDTATWTQTAEIQAGDLVGNIGITPDGKTVYAAGLERIEDGGANNLQLFIIDLENNQTLGTIRGLSLPVAFEFAAGKPAIPTMRPPLLTVF